MRSIVNRPRRPWAVAVAAVGLLGLVSTVEAAGKPKLLEAEQFLPKGKDKYRCRDKRASGKSCAGMLLPDKRARPLVEAKLDLPPGDYVATFWLEAQPIDTLHGLAVTLRAGRSAITLGTVHFSPEPGYQPFRMRFFHPGGTASIGVAALGSTGFDAMRGEKPPDDKAGGKKGPKAPKWLDDNGEGGDAGLGDDGDDDGGGDVIAELGGEKSVASFQPFELRLLCDRIEVALVRPAPVAVTRVNVDKIHYSPGETVKATVQLRGCAAGGEYELLAEDVTEIDQARKVFSKRVTIARGATRTVAFEFPVGKVEFGHELRCSLVKAGKTVHSAARYYGVSRNVYRIGITAGSGPQSTRDFTVARAEKLMVQNVARYGNYFERFAWAPCDYSNLAPKTELFSSGQTQYPGSITGMRNLIQTAHKYGLKAITYGKACGGGIEGFKTFQKYPDIFHFRPEGTSTESMHVFFLERMLADDYNLFSKPIDGGWQHWASLWTQFDLKETLDVGSQAVIEGTEMFGWDGIRWDGHFVGNQQPFIDALNRKYPAFAHGYNVAFANPGSKLFLPPARDAEDFHTIAANHGLIMDESVRDWSRWSPNHGDTIHPFYAALCNEADYVKRIGGLPLYITFDARSLQDQMLCVLSGLAAGQRYTYINSPGDFPFGSLPKFLTRYSAFVWDDTRMVAEPGKHVTVTVGKGPKPDKASGLVPAPWWRKSSWLRKLPNGRQQLLINLLNPPTYRIFLRRSQNPPATLRDVAIRVKTPAGAKLVRATHVSPDLVEGAAALTPAADGDAQTVRLPRLRNWSIVVLEYDGAADPAFALTTPVKDAAAVLKKQADEQARKDAAKRAKAGIGPSAVKKKRYYSDFAKTYNVDLKLIKKPLTPKDATVPRDGRLDVHHARGPFSWHNPVEAAVALVGGGRYAVSWVDLVGFKLRGKGCMDGFPATYDELRKYDVVVLDNVHAWHIGLPNRVRLLEYVRNGGSVLIFGGYYNLSMGTDHNTSLAAIAPVRIVKFRNVRRDLAKGLALRPAAKGFFGPEIDWDKTGLAFDMDVSPPRDGADVVLTAGGKPGIVTARVGKGRVAAVMFNSHGDYAKGLRPYWKSAHWPRIIAACLRWLAADAKKVRPLAVAAKKLDKTKPLPEHLFLEAIDMNSKEFTRKLKAARVNMIDAENARTLLETALDNVDKIEDASILADVARRAGEYVDKSFVPLAKKLLESQHDFLRGAGYQILGMAGDPKQAKRLMPGLKEDRREVVRAALVACGRLKAPSLIAPIRVYLRRGSEKLLALSVLKRLGDRKAVADAMGAYEQRLVRKINLKCGHRSLVTTLWGGVSFKLLPAQRRILMAEFRTVVGLRKEVDFDLAYFIDSLADLDAGEFAAAADYLAAATRSDMTATAYAVFARLPAAQKKQFRQKMKSAKMEALRFLAE